MYSFRVYTFIYFGFEDKRTININLNSGDYIASRLIFLLKRYIIWFFRVIASDLWNCFIQIFSRWRNGIASKLMQVNLSWWFSSRFTYFGWSCPNLSTENEQYENTIISFWWRALTLRILFTLFTLLMVSTHFCLIFFCCFSLSVSFALPPLYHRNTIIFH